MMARMGGRKKSRELAPGSIASSLCQVKNVEKSSCSELRPSFCKWGELRPPNPPTVFNVNLTKQLHASISKKHRAVYGYPGENRSFISTIIIIHLALFLAVKYVFVERHALVTTKMGLHMVDILTPDQDQSWQLTFLKH